MQASVAAPDSLPGLMDDPSFGDASDPTGLMKAYQAGLMAGHEAARAEQPVQPTQAVQTAQGRPDVRLGNLNNLNDSQWGNVSAIQRVQEEEAGHYATLDGIIDEITDAIPSPIADCLKKIFRFSHQQVDLMTKLDFCKLESFIIYGALSVRDMVATVSRRFLYEPDLPLLLFVARVLSLVFHTHAQEQQHNILAVGRSDFQVDLKKLPTDSAGIAAFVTSIHGYQYKGAIRTLKRKDVDGEIKHEIQRRTSDPLVGSVVEVRSQSGYIRNLRYPDDVSEVTNPGLRRQGRSARNAQETPLETHFRGG